MAVFAFYIEKEEPYFGGVKRFGNTYHYSTAPGQVIDDEILANELIASERKITSSDVTFVGWRTWGPTDGPIIDSIIRDAGVVNLQGLGTTNPGMYREVCALFSWDLPRSPVLNRRRFLRKFIRVPAKQGAAFNSGELEGGSALTAASQTALNVYSTEVTELGALETIRLCTASGVEAVGSGGVRPYLYTRQIGK